MPRTGYCRVNAGEARNDLSSHDRQFLDLLSACAAAVLALLDDSRLGDHIDIAAEATNAAFERDIGKYSGFLAYTLLEFYVVDLPRLNRGEPGSLYATRDIAVYRSQSTCVILVLSPMSLHLGSLLFQSLPSFRFARGRQFQIPEVVRRAFGSRLGGVLLLRRHLTISLAKRYANTGPSTSEDHSDPRFDHNASLTYIGCDDARPLHHSKRVSRGRLAAVSPPTTIPRVYMVFFLFCIMGSERLNTFWPSTFTSKE